MKPKKGSKKAPTKVPERFVPIVDAVVEMVFARLEDAAAKAKRPTKAKSTRAKDAGAGAQGAPRSDGLAGAVADLLLATLTHQPVVKKTKKLGAKKKRKV